MGMKRARTTVEAPARKSLLLGDRPPVDDLVRVASHANAWSTVLERCRQAVVDLELGGAGGLMPGGRWGKRRCWSGRRPRRHGATRGRSSRASEGEESAEVRAGTRASRWVVWSRGG